MTSPLAAPPAPLTFMQQIRSFPRAFWVANVIELIERFSFYGIRIVGGLYVVAAVERGGLGMTNADKGTFWGTWALVQCLVPMFSGGFADRFGYRRSLLLAFCINIVGYALMAFTTGWWSFMFACCMVGTGTAIFKPPLHGTLAHAVNVHNSSVGWGIFYAVVNVGAFIGPMLMGYLRLLQWKYAFLAASAVIVVNITVMLLFLEDYAGRGASADAHLAARSSRSPLAILKDTFVTLSDLQLVLFLAIFSAFWFMFMEFSDQAAIYIDQWVDSSDIAHFLVETLGLEFLRGVFAANNGQINPEWLFNVDAGAIVLFVVLVTYITGKFRHISAMIVGMLITCAGVYCAGIVNTGWLCALGVFIYAVGEMTCSPKFQEYVGLMAPPEKKALYMGFSNLPFAIGWAGANFVGGPVYDRLADKFELARYHLIHALHESEPVVRSLSKGKVMPLLAEKLGTTEDAARRLLWDTYHPMTFWYLYLGIGLLSTLAMLGYHFWLERRRRSAAI